LFETLLSWLQEQGGEENLIEQHAPSVPSVYKINEERKIRAPEEPPVGNYPRAIPLERKNIYSFLSIN